MKASETNTDFASMQIDSKTDLITLMREIPSLELFFCKKLNLKKQFILQAIADLVRNTFDPTRSCA